jgi:type II secretory pathway pseudopilin PulG
LSRSRSGGFTYLGILFAVAVLGFALSAAGTLWTVSARREREAQLLWVGAQYQHAVARYYHSGPPGLQQYPQSIDDLLEDRRGPVLMRHLRSRYPDPMTGAADWILDRLPDGSILGVRSASQARPIKQAGFNPEQAAFAEAACYCDWAFVYLPALATAEIPDSVKF